MRTIISFSLSFLLPPVSPLHNLIRSHNHLFHNLDPNQSRLLRRLQLLLNILLQALGARGGSPASDNLAGAADEEFLEVPLDATEAEEASFLVFEVFVDRRLVVAVDFDLLEDGEGNAVVQPGRVSSILIAFPLSFHHSIPVPGKLTSKSSEPPHHFPAPVHQTGCKEIR